MELILVTLASAAAGCIDSIVGGGGLILVPALFASFPNAHPATLFGTNKAAAIWGTGMAALRYSRRVQLPMAALWPAVLSGFCAALLGAWLVTQASPGLLRKLLPLILLLVLLYTLARKEFGQTHAPRFSGLRESLLASGIGATIGLYDGFFGPGTGSFFVFFLVRLLGYDFLHASAAAKWLNTATNLAALLIFALKGHVWWHYALAMALANLLGSVIGTHLALKHGSGFVRRVFLGVVALLLLKTGYDAFLR